VAISLQENPNSRKRFKCSNSTDNFILFLAICSVSLTSPFSQKVKSSSLVYSLLVSVKSCLNEQKDLINWLSLITSSNLPTKLGV
jgi:hypothetical protein